MFFFLIYRILEARKRLGGRISTVSIGGCKAELGANFIHGILGNPLYELAASNGLVELGKPPKPHNVAATTEDGRRVPFAILQEIYEAYYWFFKRCEEYFLSKYEVSLVILTFDIIEFDKQTDESLFAFMTIYLL